MSELLQAVLTDPSARTSEGLPAAAAKAANEFYPWANAEVS